MSIEPNDSDSEYAQQANAACEETATSYSNLAVPGDGAGDEEFAQYAFGASDILGGWHSRLSALTPLGAQEETHDAMVFRLGLLRDSWESAAIARRAGDGFGWDQHLDEAENYAFDFDRFAAQLSLDSCRLS